MPHRRHAPQRRLDGRRHGTEVPLAGVELPEGIADMDALDGVGTDPASAKVAATTSAVRSAISPSVLARLLAKSV
jgi:hypothetical protein